MSDTTATFNPTRSELELLRELDSGVPLPFPEAIKHDYSERLYEHGFLSVGVNGRLVLSGRGHELLARHPVSAAA